jgi:hypothetical protein
VHERRRSTALQDPDELSAAAVSAAHQPVVAPSPTHTQSISCVLGTR